MRILDSIGLHRVENVSHTEGAVSLHLYSPPFQTCQTFDQRTGHRNTVKMTFWSKYGDRTPFVRDFYGFNTYTNPSTYCSFQAQTLQSQTLLVEVMSYNMDSTKKTHSIAHKNMFMCSVCELQWHQVLPNEQEVGSFYCVLLLSLSTAYKQLKQHPLKI